LKGGKGGEGTPNHDRVEGRKKGYINLTTQRKDYAYIKRLGKGKNCITLLMMKRDKERPFIGTKAILVNGGKWHFRHTPGLGAKKSRSTKGGFLNKSKGTGRGRGCSKKSKEWLARTFGKWEASCRGEMKRNLSRGHLCLKRHMGGRKSNCWIALWMEKRGRSRWGDRKVAGRSEKQRSMYAPMGGEEGSSRVPKRFSLGVGKRKQGL